MPPSRGKPEKGSGATKKGASKSVSSTSASLKGHGRMRVGRKSLAVDPTLLQSSSEGEGNQDDDDVDDSGQGETNKPSKGLSAVSRRYGPPQASADSPGTRRSTRLSGDRVESGGVLSAKAKAAAPAMKKNKPDKRKVPPSPTANTHPTPPDTDADANDVDLAVPANSKKSKSNNMESISKVLSIPGNGTRQKTLLPLKYVSPLTSRVARRMTKRARSHVTVSKN